MIITENGATNHWCPFVRAEVTWPRGENNIAVAAVNRLEGDDWCEVASCIGSSCMAWRFIDAAQKRDGTGRGYCGLAGKP